MEVKTQKGKEMKRRIMSSAQKLFHKKGFEATSVREIIEDAGCSKGTFYLYFETKTDLIYELANELSSIFSKQIGEMMKEVSEDPLKQIEDVLNVLVHSLQNSEGQMRLMHTNDMLKLVLESNMGMKFMDDTIEHIANFLGEGIRRGYFRKVDPVLYAKLIFTICHDTLESSMLFSYPDEVTIVKNELIVIIRKILEK